MMLCVIDFLSGHWISDHGAVMALSVVDMWERYGKFGALLDSGEVGIAI